MTSEFLNSLDQRKVSMNIHAHSNIKHKTVDRVPAITTYLQCPLPQMLHNIHTYTLTLCQDLVRKQISKAPRRAPYKLLRHCALSTDWLFVLFSPFKHKQKSQNCHCLSQEHPVFKYVTRFCINLSLIIKLTNCFNRIMH